MSGRLPGSARRARQLGRRRVPAAPPAGPAASLRPPGELPDDARRVWRRDAPTVPGGLRAADVSTFAIACRVSALTEILLGRAETALAAADGEARTPNVLSAAAKLAKLASELRRNMTAVLDRYEIEPDVRKAVLEDDVGAIAPLVNAYLLRFYFQIRGMPEAEFIARLNALNERKGSVHG